MLTDRDGIRVVAETDEELLISNVSDDALERASGVDGVAGGQRFSLIYSTDVAGGCACPV